MITCIAIDDEPLALRLLEDNISHVPYLQLVAGCRNAFDAMKMLEENKVDLVFIDIQMPGLSGLQFIKSLVSKPMVIFITAYKQYALEGYDLDVIDYLVKPVALDRFIMACNKAKELYDLKAAGLKGNLPAANYFFLNVDYSQVKIMYDDIIWIEGVRDYIKIYLKSTPKPIMSRNTLKTIELELSVSKFLRIHKSYIVAIESITAVRKSSLFLKDMELPIGETFRDVIDKLMRKDF